MSNPNCDGSGPHAGSVRVLPLARDANAILCFACFQAEIAWRRSRNLALSSDAQYDLPRWESLDVYEV